MPICIPMTNVARSRRSKPEDPASSAPAMSHVLLTCTLGCAVLVALGTSSRVALAALGDRTGGPAEHTGKVSPLSVGGLSMRAPTLGGRRALGPSAEGILMLADNVVVTPTPPPPPPQPNPGWVNPGAPTAAPAVTSVNLPPPPTSNTVVETPRSNKVVHVDVAQPHNYMTTIAVSGLMGAVAGGLVGGAVYFLGDRNDAQNIAYWAAGGVLVGAGVGLVQIIAEESRASEATALRKLPTDPAPTLRLALLRTHF